MRRATKQTDQASAALVKDLKQRGLLEDTLVVWGGEFGRTSFSQGKLTHKVLVEIITQVVIASGWQEEGLSPE